MGALIFGNPLRICRLLENILDRWNVNVHNSVMYHKHTTRVLTRAVLCLARTVFNDWAYQVDHLAIVLSSQNFAFLPSAMTNNSGADS